MKKKIGQVHPDVRNTLEYGEARRLIAERDKVKQRLMQLDGKISFVRQISPLAVELARMDVSEDVGKSPLK